MARALLLVWLLAGCASPTYTYVDQVRSGQVLERPLYTVVVPAVSVFSKYPGKDVQWERYSRDGVPDDLVLKEGYAHSSYAATVEVVERLNVRSLDELKAHVVNQRRRANRSRRSRVRRGMHTMHCADRASGHYYELALSFMTRRRNWFPQDDLEQGARHFFGGFTLR